MFNYSRHKTQIRLPNKTSCSIIITGSSGQLEIFPQSYNAITSIVHNIHKTYNGNQVCRMMNTVESIESTNKTTPITSTHDREKNDDAWEKVEQFYWK